MADHLGRRQADNNGFDLVVCSGNNVVRRPFEHRLGHGRIPWNFQAGICGVPLVILDTAHFAFYKTQ